MHPWLRTTLAVAAVATSAAGSARAQWAERAPGPPPVAIALPASVITPDWHPAFSTPLGGGQGYGYAPSASWVNPGLQLGAYYDGTVSSPFRPGSVNADVPRHGYFPTGEGPYVFPTRPRHR